ncbi:MAG: aldo/keto reductase [Oscillospiraceae bacterium]|nr:aldo/keto reductase [Oscillospiraceae bacterium]
MQYRINQKTGERISVLGAGCMRLHKDEREAEKHVRYLIEKGVNYFDTAYSYGDSEEKLGRILAKDGLRERVKIATKLPHYFVRKGADFDGYFDTQRERLQTDHIDYYMVHMLPNLASWERLVDLGLMAWVEEKRNRGQIGQFGFSFHGSCGEFKALIDAYDWDFCMIQYNYYDVNFQAGREGLLYAAERGMPVFVMEPLRGGMLVNKLPEAAKQIWAAAPGEQSAAERGLRWVWDHPQVLSVLSGMGTMEMVVENVRVASEAAAETLTAEDLARYEAVSAAIRGGTRVACTHCGYCVPCPFGVDIPLCFSYLNETRQGRYRAMGWYAATMEGHKASLCTGCGKCEPLCPQEISIREKLAEATRVLEGFPYGILRVVVRWVLKHKKVQAFAVWLLNAVGRRRVAD